AGTRSSSYSPPTSLRRKSFPTGERGIALTKTYRRGRLKLASPDVRQNSSSSSGSTAPRRLMKATKILPQRSSASPTTATSKTAECSDKQLSISTGEIFSPPLMIMSSTRPLTNTSPPLSNYPSHPPNTQPSH